MTKVQLIIDKILVRQTRKQGYGPGQKNIWLNLKESVVEQMLHLSPPWSRLSFLQKIKAQDIGRNTAG